jgi:hypothetical protein
LKSSQFGNDGGSRFSTNAISAHRADYSKSIFKSIFIFVFVAVFVVDGVAAQTSAGVVWNPLADGSNASSSTPTSTELDRQPSSSPTVTTLQAMASQSKTQRRRPPVENDVLPPVTIVDNNNNVGAPPTVTYVDNKNVIIPTFDVQPSVVSTSKDEILVDTKEEKAASRPEEEKDIFIYDDIYPRRVKPSTLVRQQHQYRQQQQHDAWRQQQRRRQDSERRRRYFVSRPWRQQHLSRPPYAPPSASGSTRYFIPGIKI